MEQEWVDNTFNKIKLDYQIDANWIIKEAKNDLDRTMRFIIDNQEFIYHIEIKNELRNHQLDQIQHLADKHKPLMIIARRIFPKLKEYLRAHEIAYLEGNGNIFLKKGKTYIYIDGNKPLVTEKVVGLRIFTKTGLKLIFEMLQDETILNMPYRKLAQKAKIGLGNVNNIVNELKVQGYLLKMNRGEWKITRKKELLEKWVAAYPEKLKPALKAGQFRFLKDEDFNNWKNLKIKPMKTWWGGEPGGDLLTHYLRPARLTLYTTETREELIKHYRLIPDVNGKIEVYNKFWDRNTANDQIAPPLLVYADLINAGDQRCIETAQKVYNEYLANQF
jgi:hypothetical protein